MVFLRVEIITKGIKLSIYKCDYCEKIYKQDYRKHKVKQEFTFCSNKCVNLSQIDGYLKTKKQNTFLEKYGEDHPLKVESIKQKVIDKSPISQKKKKETTLLKYGVDHTFQSEEIKEKRRKTLLERYGVEHPTQLLSCMEKQNQTKKKNHTHGKSKEEDNFYLKLCKIFGKKDIERQIIIHNNWCIDFYIKSIKLYVQYDGVYWHGLDRPLIEIMKFRTKQDKVIYGKYLTDRQQEVWFKEKKLNLCRIISTELKTLTLNKEFFIKRSSFKK